MVEAMLVEMTTYGSGSLPVVKVTLVEPTRTWLRAGMALAFRYSLICKIDKQKRFGLAAVAVKSHSAQP